MSVAALSVLGAYCVICSLADLTTRRISNVLTCCGLADGILGGWLGWWEWSWLGVVLAMIPLVVARIPAGDIKGMMVVGGFLGPLVCYVDALALGCAYLLWWAHHKGRVTFVGTWPFFPWCAGSTCVIVLISRWG